MVVESISTSRYERLKPDALGVPCFASPRTDVDMSIRPDMMRFRGLCDGLALLCVLWRWPAMAVEAHPDGEGGC